MVSWVKGGWDDSNRFRSNGRPCGVVGRLIKEQKSELRKISKRGDLLTPLETLQVQFSNYKTNSRSSTRSNRNSTWRFETCQRVRK